MHEQAHVSAPPPPGPRPCSRSTRAAPSGRKAAARRATWIAAGPRDPNGLAPIAAEVGASRSAAPMGFAHSNWVASIDHSHAGNALTAVEARRGWRSQTRLPAGSLIGIALSCRRWILDLDF